MAFAAGGQRRACAGSPTPAAPPARRGLRRQGDAALAPVDDREALEPLAEALQKTALDHALLAFGLPANTRLRAAR